ncbi:MAG: DUF2807 domain-containing protein [Gemmatimonadales bacterium]|nr:DUF2807 domain-containing protein [Gemmatimonadales bacterium]
MMRYLLRVIGVAALPIATGCSDVAGTAGHIVGSGYVVTESRAIPAVERVTVSGVGHLIIERGPRAALTVTAEDNLLPVLTSVVAGEELMLGASASIQPTRDIVYRLTVPAITGIAVSGAASIDAYDVRGTFLAVTISGVGSVFASGVVGAQDVLVSGSGRYEGANLDSRVAYVLVSGTGSAVVRAREFLDVTVSGAGLVEFFGTPQVRQTISGTGAIVWRGR